MLRRALVVVMAVVLLQPPGYCLCRLSAAPARPADAPAVAEAPRPTCPCCRPAVPPEAPARMEPSLPRLDHLPGCPLADTAAYDRPAAPDGLVTPAPALTDLIPLAPAITDHATPSHRPAPPRPAPPLRC